VANHASLAAFSQLCEGGMHNERPHRLGGHPSGATSEDYFNPLLTPFRSPKRDV
jgi:hypothetical protein